MRAVALTLQGQAWYGLTQSGIMAATKEKNAHARTMAAAHRSTVATFRNIGRPYHRKVQYCRLRYVLKYLHLVANSKRQTAPNSEGRLLLRNPPPIELQTIGHGEQHLAPQSILYCNYRQSVINSLLLTLARRNQFFIVNNDKVQLIVDCYLRQSVINSLFFIASKWD